MGVTESPGRVHHCGTAAVTPRNDSAALLFLPRELAGKEDEKEEQDAVVVTDLQAVARSDERRWDRSNTADALKGRNGRISSRW